MKPTATPAERSPKIARQQANRRARQIRADLANRKDTDPALYRNVAASYRQMGFGLDGYPVGYAQDLKTL